MAFFVWDTVQYLMVIGKDSDGGYQGYDIVDQFHSNEVYMKVGADSECGSENETDFESDECHKEHSIT